MSEKEPKQIETSSKTPKPRRRSIGTGLALLLSSAALAASASLWYMLFVQQQELFTSQLPETVRQLRGNIDELKTNTTAARTDIDQIKETQETLTEALRQTKQSLGKSRTDWVLAETEQLLLVASQRLQLAGDIDTATTALEIADQRLRGLADPDLLPVRKVLAKEMHALKSVERADIAGLAVRIGILADAVETLPLSLEITFQQPPEAVDKTEKQQDDDSRPGFFQEVWNDLLSLMRIRTNVESYKPLLPPEQQYFLRENLRLLLYGAQQAVLRTDGATYRHNLQTARRWVDEYFDTHSQPIRHLVKELDQLLDAKLTAKLPKISGSLKLLREITRKKAGL